MQATRKGKAAAAQAAGKRSRGETHFKTTQRKKERLFMRQN
jgi:hypothetical protein